MTCTIRSELSGDEAAIHALTRAAFLDAPYASQTEPFIVDALREAGALALSLVAEQEGRLVGHVAVSPVTIGAGEVTGWYGLGPISVLPAYQRRGVGSLLMHAALDALRGRGAAGCVVLGDPAYYGRFGFAPAAPLVLPDVPPDHFQAICFSGAKPGGEVRYHAAFEATG